MSTKRRWPTLADRARDLLREGHEVTASQTAALLTAQMPYQISTGAARSALMVLVQRGEAERSIDETAGAWRFKAL